MITENDDHAMTERKIKDELDSRVSTPESEPRRTRHLLSLDGGGVRGLASLAVLDKLMRLIDPIRPPKPCQVFDMIGGTSTGGLIAVMLGRLEMSANESIKAYRSLASQSFTPKGGWPFPLTFDWETLSFNPRCCFDSAGLEAVIKELVKLKLDDENELLLQEDPACKVFVCATSAYDYYTTRLFQNYGCPEHEYMFPDVKIWEACRATSAAPGFFEPITIEYGQNYSDTFRDGATGCNNPVNKVYENALKLWPEDELCVISIGTGRPVRFKWDHNLTGLIEVLIKISTETERTALSFVESHPDVRYFRFNVENGVGEIKLHEHEKAGQILADSQTFLERPKLRVELETCAEGLRAGAMYENHRGEPVSAESEFKLVAKASSMFSRCLKTILFLLSIMIATLWMLSPVPVQTDIELPALNLTWPVFALIGRTGAGKSSFIKTLGGRHIETLAVPIIGDSLKSCTNEISWFKAVIEGQPLYLIDSPGFDDDYLDDETILQRIWNDFKNATSMHDRHVTGLIFLHDITQQRVGGGMLRNMDSLQNLLGHDDFYRLALITTRWTDSADRATYDTWVEREHELINDYWNNLVEAGAVVIRYDGTFQRARIIIQQLIINREKKLWSKSRLNRRVTKDLEPTKTPKPIPSESGKTPKPTPMPARSTKTWLWRTEWQIGACVANFGLIVGTIYLFKVPGPDASTFGMFLGYLMVIDAFIFLSLVLKWITGVLARWARSG